MRRHPTNIQRLERALAAVSWAIVQDGAAYARSSNVSNARSRNVVLVKM